MMHKYNRFTRGLMPSWRSFVILVTHLRVIRALMLIRFNTA